jgi:Ni,Fe-hydrogenase I cytochrome b subunit
LDCFYGLKLSLFEHKTIFQKSHIGKSLRKSSVTGGEEIKILRHFFIDVELETGGVLLKAITFNFYCLFCRKTARQRSYLTFHFCFFKEGNRTIDEELRFGE